MTQHGRQLQVKEEFVVNEIDPDFTFNDVDEDAEDISIIGLDTRKTEISQGDFLVKKYREELSSEKDIILLKDIKIAKHKLNNVSDAKINTYLVDDQKEEQKTTFGDMGLSHVIQTELTSMGYTYPTKIQEETIKMALEGRDICGRAATGSGKTCAFLIPVAERLLYRNRDVKHTRVLIILPTRELAVQCYEISTRLFKPTKVNILLLIGGTIRDKQFKRLAKDKSPDVIIATPGRLSDLLEKEDKLLSNVEILILDEADRIFEQEFAHELNQIIKTTPKQKQTMLFSATISDKLEELITISLKNPANIFVDSALALADNIDQNFIKVRNASVDVTIAMLLALVEKYYYDRTIIFIQEKYMVQRIANLMKIRGIKVCELHGNMLQSHRLKALNDFKNGHKRILLATDLAARGLDIPNVVNVINHTLPTTYTQYQHRIGRTARAGKSGYAISLFADTDRKLVKQAIKSSTGRVSLKSIPSNTLNIYLHIVKKIYPLAVQLEKSLKEINSKEAMKKRIDRMDETVNSSLKRIYIKKNKSMVAIGQ